MDESRLLLESQCNSRLESLQRELENQQKMFGKIKAEYKEELERLTTEKEAIANKMEEFSQSLHSISMQLEEKEQQVLDLKETADYY